MPTRKETALLQYKLRIREALRRKIAKAAEKRGVSANYEMTWRLEQSFEREDMFSIHDVAEDLRIVWARCGNAFHELNKQGDLMRAAEALMKAVEQLPEISGPIQTALKKTKAAMQLIEIEAVKLPHLMHTSGAE
jgi:hypothetical protein